MKTFILLYFLLINLYAQENLIETLQDDFYNHVIVLSNFKKLNDQLILNKCKDFDLECQIKELKESYDNSKQLQDAIEYHKSRTYTSPKYLKNMITKIREKIDTTLLNKKEFVVAIDLEKQLLVLFLYQKNDDRFYKIGSDLISGGDMEKEEIVKFGEDHYFTTPTGVFRVKSGWRSDGEYKYFQDETYLPYGVKNRFIYYIGKVESIRLNTFDKNKQKIEDPSDWKLIKDTLEFALHAHNSQAHFGQPYSHGCVRLRDELNYFLDTNSVLHKPFIKNNRWYSKKRIEPPTNMKNQEYAGEYVVIFSSI